MAYRTIDEMFWTDRRVKKEFSKDEKILFFYVLTNQHSHYSGIYYISEAMLMDETGLTKKELTGAIKSLSEKEPLYYDPEAEIIFIVNMFDHQMRNGNPKNMVKGVPKHLDTLHKTPLIGKFLTRYASHNIPFTIPSGWDTPCMGGEVAVEVTVKVTGEGEERGEEEPSPPPLPEVQLHGEFRNVKLTGEDFEKLRLLYGEKETAEYIERLSGHLKSTGKTRYKDHYATIRNWLRGDGKEPYDLCTAQNLMPREEKNPQRWRHPDTEEAVFKPPGHAEGVPAIRCKHCKKLIRKLTDPQDRTQPARPGASP